MKLRSLIVDDEKDVAMALQLMLQSTFPELAVTGICPSALDAAKYLKQEQVDILFLDVEMPGGTGFDLLELVNDKVPYIIFTTAHAGYAIQAIKHGARDYLLKPIDPDELAGSVKKASGYLRSQNKPVQVQKAVPTLSVHTAKGIVFLNKEDILYIKADGRYSELFCRGEQHYTVCKNVGEYETELGSDFFFRVHKSYLINCRHIVKINPNNGGFVEMSNHKEIELSKRKKSEFLRFLK